MARVTRWNPYNQRTKRPKQSESALDFVGQYGYRVNDDFEEMSRFEGSNFGNSTGSSASSGFGGSQSSQSAPNPRDLCKPNFLPPSSVSWEGDDCENVQVAIPAAEKVPHYKNLLDPEFLNGIYLSHAIGKEATCNNIVSRKPEWTSKTLAASAMYPMLTDSKDNIFHILTETSDLWTAIKKSNLWRQDAVFIGINRADIKTERWFGGVRAFEMSAQERLQQLEYLRAMFVPHASRLQEKYAPEAFNAPRPKNFFLDADVPRRFASPPLEHMIDWSRYFTKQFGAEDLATQLRDTEEAMSYGIVGRTFFDTMQKIEEISVRSGKKFPHHFVFFVGGSPTVITGLIVQLVATAVSVTVTALTGGAVTISPAAIAKLLNTIIDFAQGKGNWQTLILAAMDIAVTMLLSAQGTGGKPLLGEQTQAIIKEAYTVAGTLVRTGDWRTAGVQVARGLSNLVQSGTIKLPNTFKIEGQDWKLLDMAMNMAFEPIVKEANIQRELATSSMTAMVKGANEFRMGVQASIAGLTRGMERAEAMYNGALKTLEKIADKGVFSILEDLNLRNSFLLTPNAAGLLTTPNLGNIASAVLNIPTFADNDASTPEAVMSFAGITAGLGFSPSVFDGLQFNALIKSAETAVKNKLPFTMPSTILPDRADDYRIKAEKCFNVSFADTSDRPAQFPVPELPEGSDPSAGESGAGGGASAGETATFLPEAPPNTTTDENGIVRNPQGAIIGNMTPTGQFAPIRTTVPQGTLPSDFGANPLVVPSSIASGAKWFPSGLKIPQGIRFIGSKPVACFTRVKVKQPNDKKPKDALACLPFLGDGFSLSETQAMYDYFNKFTPDGKPRTKPTTKGLNDAVLVNGNSPIGVQISCVAEAMLKENISEAAIRQFYDNLPNERMTSRTRRTFGDEGVVHFEEYSRKQLANSNDLAPLEPLQRDFAGMFVWSVVEDAGRNCFTGWRKRSFIRNSQILDAEGKPMSGFYTLNDGWKSLADGGLMLGAIFVRLMPNGTPHTGIVVKKDGDFFETIEANALANSGRGTNAPVQRFRIAVTEAVDWKFLHVWEDSTVNGIKSPITGRCCVVPSPTNDSPIVARPLPTQTSPRGTVGGWIPTDDQERRDTLLRETRSQLFHYHTPQVYQGETGVWWKAIRNVMNSALFPTKVPLELQRLGYELNPEPLGAKEDNYEYLPEGVIALAYRRRFFTEKDRPAYIKQKLATAKKLQAEKQARQQRGRNPRHTVRGGLRDEFDGLMDSLEDTSLTPMQNAIVCAAEKLLQERPSGNQIRQRYGGDFHFNRYEPLDSSRQIAATQEDYCAMFVWLVWANAYNCLGGSIDIAAKPTKGQYCLYKNSRVKDSTGTTQPGQSLYQGSSAPKGSVPKVGAVFIANRNSGAGGHTGIVVKVNPNGSFETIEGNGTQKPVARYTYPNPAAANIIGFLYPFEAGCAPRTMQPRAQGTYCCPPEEPPKERGCGTCTGGGVRQTDGTCRCPQGTMPDPQNPCNCVPMPPPQVTPICPEAKPAQLDGDCRVDRDWVRAAQNEPRDPNFVYTPQGCWKCERIRSTNTTCNEPEPPRDPECQSIWISRSPSHVTDTTRFKYVGRCWYCERAPRPQERNPQCPENVPAIFGTGWERTPSGDLCSDTARYDYFRTSTGMCCFRKPKQGVPPPQNAVPPPPRTTTPPPPSVPPQNPPRTSTCNTCNENEDIREKYDVQYNDWDEYSIFPAYYSDENKMWFANIYGRIVPYTSQELEIEEVEGLTPANVQVQTSKMQMSAARVAGGETQAVEELKQSVLDVSNKLDTTALITEKLDQKVKAAIQEALKQIKEDVKAANVSAWDKGVVDARVDEIAQKLDNFDAVQMQQKVQALESGVGKIASVIETLPQAIAQAQAVAQAEAQTEAQAINPQASKKDVEAIAKTVQEMQTMMQNSKAADCVGQLIKKLDSTIGKLDAAVSSTGSVASKQEAEKLQAALAPLAVKMEEMKRELVQTTQQATTQATQQATAQATAQATEQAKTEVAAQAQSTIEALAKDVIAALEAQRKTAGVQGQQQMALVQKLAEDALARSEAKAANVDALVKPLQELVTTLQTQQASPKALEMPVQSLVATMQTLPVPEAALQQHYQMYNDQIAMLKSQCDYYNNQIFLANARRNEQARRQAMLAYYNTLALYQQQCNVCPSCPSAVSFF